MESNSPITTMPNEMLQHIIRYLRWKDLSAFTKVCKHFYEVASPLLWSNIDLFSEEFHRTQAEFGSPPEDFRLPHEGPRPFQDSHCANSDDVKRSERFFGLLFELFEVDPDRLRQLGGRIRRFCAMVNSPLPAGSSYNYTARSIFAQITTAWHVLPYMYNLESLELHGSFVNPVHLCIPIAPITDVPLSKLRHAKLYAYIPREVAQYVLQSSPTLERLELGMLAFPRRGAYIGSELDFPTPRGVFENEDEYRQRTIGQLSLDEVLPMPLSGFLPEQDRSIADVALPSLTHLLFCQVCDTGNYRIDWSDRAEAASHADLRRIIVASYDTLETLVLEQRRLEQPDGLGGTEPGNTQEDGEGVGSKPLVALMRSLLAEKNQLPALKQVYLKGITVNDFTPGNSASISCPGGQLMRDLERRNIRCEAYLGRWASNIGWPALVSPQEWASYGDRRDIQWGMDHLEDETDHSEDEEIGLWPNTLLCRV